MERKKLYYKATEDEISWQAYEFLYYKKDKQWFLVFWIISASVFVSLIILKNIFGAATIALFTIVLYMYAIKKPNIIECKINRQKVIFDNKAVPLSGISHFWIVYNPPIKELILISKHRATPKISIPLENADPLQIREFLLENGVIEKEVEESISEAIARKLKF